MANREILILQPDQPLRLDDTASALLRVDAGIVWLTAETMAGDRFLIAGQCLSLPCGGKVLAEAVRGTARISLERAGNASPASALQRLVASLTGTLVAR